MAMAVIHLVRPALPPATVSSPSLRPCGRVLRLRVSCRAVGSGGDGEGGGRGAGIAVRQGTEAAGDGTGVCPLGGEGGGRGGGTGWPGRKRGVAAAAEFEKAAVGADGKRERSMALNSEGLEIARNLTTNEAANQSRYAYLRGPDGRFRNPYNLGCQRNCADFLVNGYSNDEEAAWPTLQQTVQRS